MASRSTISRLPSDAEERVEEPVGELPVAPYRARVYPAERGQHQASGVEFEDRRQLGEVPGRVREPVRPDRDLEVTGVAAGHPYPDRQRLGRQLIGGRL